MASIYMAETIRRTCILVTMPLTLEREVSEESIKSVRSTDEEQEQQVQSATEMADEATRYFSDN